MVGNKLVAVIAAIIGVLVVAAAGVYLYQEGQKAKTEAPQMAEPAAPPAPAPPEAEEAEPPSALPTEGKAVPSFDVVRIEPSGEGVIAGRAEPGWRVMLFAGTAQIAEVVADEEGQWAIVLEEPLDRGEHSLTLKGISKDGTRALTSQQSVMVAIGEETVVALSEPGQPTRLLEQPAAEEVVTVEAEGVWYEVPRPEGAPAPEAGPRIAWYDKPREEPAQVPTMVPAPEEEIAAAGQEIAALEREVEAAEGRWYETSPAPEIALSEPTEWYNKPRAEPAIPGSELATRLAAVEPKSESRLGAEAAPEPHVTRAEEPSRAFETEIQKTPPKAPEPVSFITADYEEMGPGTGMVFLTGSAEPGARILLYMDNDPVGEVAAGSDGRWIFSLAKVLTPGEHRFRADQVEDGAQVVSRAEIGMERIEPGAVAAAEPEAKPTAPEVAEKPKAEEPEAKVAGAETGRAAEALREQARGPRVHVVVRGDTLWEIAERYLGGGWRYTKIYRSNRKQIRDPHWIYPNQKFKIPAR